MPALTITRQEKFAQLLADGLTQTAAYEQAGYRASRSHGARLAARVDVRARVAELLNADRMSRVATTDALLWRVLAVAEDCLKHDSGEVSATARFAGYRTDFQNDDLNYTLTITPGPQRDE